jgi:hypothetical protein
MSEGFKGKGSYAFGEKNLVACTVTSDPYEWKTEYFEEGHFQKPVGNTTDHRTAAINASFSCIRKE